MQYSKNLLKDIIQWDIKVWSQVLSFWENNFELKPKMNALTIGEREGGMTLWLAQKGISVTCTDYNQFPEETKKLHQRYRVEELIEYKEGVDVTDLSRYADNSFDIVLFKSVIGALSDKDRQQKAINEMRRVLKPGGALLFAENLKGSKLHVALRKKFIKWDSYWRYLDYQNDMDLFSSFNEKHIKSIGFATTFGRSEGQRNFLSYFDLCVGPVLPSKMKYVLMGVLIK